MKKFGFIAGLRILLWWGAETMRRFARFSEKQAIIQVAHDRCGFPDARWVFGDKQSACLAFDSQEKEIRIVVSKMGMN